MYSEQALAQALSPRLMELIILPTEKCNFRCTYCYEDFSIGRMSKQTIDSVKKLITNRVSEIDQLSISWFGGEPLLAKDICTEISLHAQQACDEHGVLFSGGFTTNGYLLDIATMRGLIALNQRDYQITLDGDEEWHNQTRIQPNRKPTFERIWNNLVGYKEIEEQFHVTLRLHVHQDNIESVKRLFERIRIELLCDPRYSVYFHKINNLNPKNTVKETLLNSQDYQKALDYISGSEPTIAGREKSEIHLTDYICYAAKPNSLMIRANGTIGKCTVALDDERNSIGKILADGTLEISNPKLRQWMLGYMDMSKSTLSCPLSTLPKSIAESPLASIPIEVLSV
jgi:uncharacterized protein